MKLRALLFLLTIPLLMVVIESCDMFCSDSCCGTSFDDYYFEIGGVELFTEGDTSTKKFDEVMVTTEFDRIDVAQYFRPTSIFINEAYGCSPPPPMSRDTLLNINVIANNDYNDLYQAGDTLNDIMTIFRAYSGEDIQSVNDFIQNMDFDNWEFAWTEFTFSFSEAPNEIIEHSFTVEFEFEDKKVSASTEMIRIMP